MRKVLSLIALLLSVSVFAPAVSADDARLRASSTLDGLVVKVKSCAADDNGDVIVVFTLDNQTSKDYNGILAPIPTEVYDDEGNVYKNEPVISFALANETFGNNEVNLPSGVLVKHKMKIKDVDPAASMLKLVKVQFRLGNLYPYSFTLKNVPITREGD